MPGVDSQLMQKSSFPPVVNAATRVLILGSLPGEASLAATQYYAHKQNRFWHLLGALLEADLPGMAYEQRLAVLLHHQIGLWDVVAKARREGSLDSNIREPVGNDLVGLLNALPQLAVIAFNGATAAKIGLKQLGEHAHAYQIFKLPSSSPAYTLAYEEKLAHWLALRQAYVHRG